MFQTKLVGNHKVTCVRVPVPLYNFCSSRWIFLRFCMNTRTSGPIPF